jgi:hydroxyacylglutathione hydrolase
MVVLMNTGGVAMTNCYLIADEEAKQAVLFDAPDHTTERLLDEARERGWDVVGLWLTHGHFDHMADHSVVKERFPKAKVLIHKLEEGKAKEPAMQTRRFGLPMEIKPLTAEGYVEDGQRLKLGRYEAEVLFTPGHAPGHVGYYFASEHLLVGGDLIIGGSVGRTDLPDSNHQDLIRSIQRVMKLPGSTKLLGGHGDVSTLDEERERNSFVREMIEAV